MEIIELKSVCIMCGTLDKTENLNVKLTYLSHTLRYRFMILVRFGLGLVVYTLIIPILYIDQR